MKILVIRFSSAGDIVLASLTLRALHTRYPEAEVHVITKEEFAPLFRYSPYVARLVTIQRGTGLRALLRLRRTLLEENNGPYDIVLDLHNSLRSRIIRPGIARAYGIFRKPSLAKWMLVHLKHNRLRPIIPIPERYLATAERFGLVNDGLGLDLFTGPASSPIARIPNRPTIALAPGARHATKRWPAERYVELGRALAERFGARIVLMGAPNERDLCNVIARGIGSDTMNLAGTTNYLESATALDACDAVVTNDSALAHIGAARKRPVVAIFGSTVQEFGFAPYGTASRVVEIQGLRCRPCTAIGREDCPLGHFNCMRTITAQQVAEAVEEVAGKG
ncbi:MAG TPA: lipopolysaccharide heptosyltransferase II [Candidatus Kapabacteria bacterium]|nr:lipopolysaccharide heptosyltransferase II [Candidatus Kapabacteria bacterium]